MTQQTAAVRDHLGRPVNQPADAVVGAQAEREVSARDIITAARHRDSVRDRASVGGIMSAVSPAALISVLTQADAGIAGAKMQLAQDIEEADGHVANLMQIRRLQVCGLKWQIEPGDESDASKQAADLYREAWDNLDAEAMMDRLIDAVLGGWAIERVVWQTGEQREGEPYWYPVGFEEVDPRRLVWPQSDAEGDPIAPVLECNWNRNTTEPLMPGRHIVHSYRTRRHQPGKGGMIRAIAAAWLIKYFTIIDFASLVEKWGRPFPKVNYPAGMTETELVALAAQLVKSMAEGTILVPEGSSAEITSAAAHITSLPQQVLIKWCEEVQAKALIGSTTITDAAESTSGAASDSVSSPTHDNSRTLIRDADARRLAACINRDLTRPWFVWNAVHFAAGARCPKVCPVLQDNAAATLEFSRKVYLQFAADGTGADMLMNATQLKELTRNVQMPVNEEYEEPYVPVRDDTQALVSGDVIRDGENDIVGGAVIPGSAPAVAMPGAFGGGFNRGGAESQRGGEVKPGEGKDAEEDVRSET